MKIALVLQVACVFLMPAFASAGETGRTFLCNDGQTRIESQGYQESFQRLGIHGTVILLKVGGQDRGIIRPAALEKPQENFSEYTINPPNGSRHVIGKVELRITRIGQPGEALVTLNNNGLPKAIRCTETSSARR